MSQSGKIWVTYNIATQQKSEPMSQQEMQLGLLTLRVAEISNLYIWTPGWENWQPLQIFLASDQKYFTSLSSKLNEQPTKKNSTAEARTAKIKEGASSLASEKNNNAASPLPAKEKLKAIRESLAKDLKNKGNGQGQGSRHGRGTSHVSGHGTSHVSGHGTSHVSGHGTSHVSGHGTSHVSGHGTGPADADAPEKQLRIKEFTQLVDPSHFSSDNSNEDFMKPDIDGDEFLKNGLPTITSKQHFDFELRPEERTYLKRAERHGLKIEVIVMLPSGNSLRSFSRDISLTGTLIEDNIPKEFQDKALEIVLVNRLEKSPSLAKLTLKGKAVGTILTRRLRFTGMTESDLDKLESMLAAYLEQQDQLQDQLQDQKKKSA